MSNFYYILNVSKNEIVKKNITDWERALKEKKKLENDNPKEFFILCAGDKRI